MPTINIHKINNDAENQLIQDLTEKHNYDVYSIEETIEMESEFFNDILYNFSMNFYLNDEQVEKELSWNWVRQEFNLKPLNYTVKPKGVLLINETKINSNTDEIEENVYAVSFGYAFHRLKDYSDKNWPIKFAEHISLNKVKSMTILSPNSVINKRINNYVNFREVLLNSGEALNQLNANLDLKNLDENFDEFKDKILISNSITFEVSKPTLNSLAYIIDYINFIISQEEIINHIPYFKEIQSKNQKEELNKLLIKDIFEDIKNNQENPCIDICEFLIIDEVSKFLFQFENFKLEYEDKMDNIDFLTVNEVYKFIKTNLNKNDDILDIKVLFNEKETGYQYNYKLKNLITYDNPKESIIFDEGDWKTYNDKYLQDLRKSIDELDVIYDEKFDFREEEYLEFLRRKAPEEGNDFDRMTTKKNKSFKKKWYKELVFNLLREDDGYLCNDRFTETVEGQKIEVADLFKLDEKSMFSVKIGNSSDLCYVVDQSLTPLKLIDNGEIKKMKNEKIKKLKKNDIDDVYLWLILTRKKKLPLRNNQPDLNKINSIILKNKIDYWKKEVIMTRRNPKIRVNYIEF